MRSEWPYAEPEITATARNGKVYEVDTRDLRKPEYFTYETPRFTQRKRKQNEPRIAKGQKPSRAETRTAKERYTQNRLRTRVRIGLVHGRYELVGIELFSDFEAPEGGTAPEWLSAIHTKDVRRLSTSVLVKEAIDAFRGNADFALNMPAIPKKDADAVRRTKAHLSKHDPRNKAGRPVVYGEAHYREVARVYLEAVAAHRPPRAAVAEWFDWPDRTAANHIHTARHEYGQIPKTTKDKR